METLTLENETLHLELSRETGALVGLTAVESGWEILNRPQLGLSYRLLVPLRSPEDWHQPGQRDNQVLGEKQAVSSIEVASDGRATTLAWDRVSSECGGPLDIRLTLRVTLTARQAIFGLTIDNRSDHPVENVYCPYLGDLQHPPGEAWFRTFLYRYATAQEWPLWPTYQNLRGYFGVDHPTQFSPVAESCGAPMSPYILLRGAREGLYVGICEESPELVAWHTELRPGYGSSIDQRVPEAPRIGGVDVATRFAAVHLPYVQPGETRALTPVALEAYRGGWQQGVDIYKRWRSSWMRTPEFPAWSREPHSWQQLHINSPEDELRVPFRKLVEVGQQCERHGVKAIQLVGWNDGGQDQGNPSHDPDPRLGSSRELRESIARIQERGVKVILFAKFTWADRATNRFRKDLVRLAVKDPYGDHYLHQGYQYQTASQLLDVNAKRLVPMCFLSEEYLKICEEEFQKILDLGADGILFDECMHHNPALLCFDASHGHRYGAPVYANDRLLIQRLARLARERNGEFLFAAEAAYDWEMEAYHLSYHRSELKWHLPLSRYMLPESQLMTAVTGFDDRNMVNQCLLYRYVISYEPYHFKGRLDDYPLTVAYGKQMDALRTELREYFWDGEFRHEVGATVSAEGQPHHPYSVFINRASGKHGLVVANYDESRSVEVEIALDDASELGRYRLVGEPEWRPTENGVILPARSAAVVIE